MRFTWSFVFLATACQFSAATLDEGTPTPGTPDAMVPAPDGPPITECTVSFCEDGALHDCAGTVTPCLNGCVAAGEAHCGAFIPSNAVALSYGQVAGLTNQTLAGGRYVINTANGGIFRCAPDGDPDDLVTIRTGMNGVAAGIFYQRINSPGSIPDIAILGFSALTIAADAEIYAIGDPTLAVVSDGPLQVLGAVRLVGGETACNTTTACRLLPGYAPSEATCNAPGGGDGGNAGNSSSGPGGGTHGNQKSEGGGGGGHGGTGGTGGLTGGAGGAVVALASLRGGGGGAGGEDDGGGRGGGGGGGLQLVSATSITVSAPDGINGGLGITVGGGGGSPGGEKGGGGGGGAGGMILLEAPTVTVSNAFLLANGGGGGSGACSGGSGDQLCWGISSHFALTAAPGGDIGAANSAQPGGDGGAGIALDGSPGLPLNDVNADGGGGGGGAVGRIIIRTASGVAAISGDRVSPQPTQGPIVVQ